MAVFITRCPSCHQAFRVTDTQLKAKEGLVRCGFCQSVFNATDHLYRSLENTSDAVLRAEREAEAERKGLADMAALANQLRGFDSVDDDATSNGLVGVRAEPRMGPVRQDVINANSSSIEVIRHEPVRLNAEAYSNQEDDEEEEEVEENSSNKSSNKAIWILIAIVAVLLIGLQGAVFMRDSIIEKLPQSRATFDTLCQYLVCPAPKNESTSANNRTSAKAGITLLSQSLQKVGGNEYVIVANLHNDGLQEQPFPVMRVILKGQKGDVLTRRQLTPKDYLNDPSQKLKPAQTRQVAFTFKMTEGIPNQLLIELANPS